MIGAEAIQRPGRYALGVVHAAHPEASSPVAAAIVQAHPRMALFGVSDEAWRLSGLRVVQAQPVDCGQQEAAGLPQGKGARQQVRVQANGCVLMADRVVALQRRAAHVDPPQPSGALAPAWRFSQDIGTLNNAVNVGIR